MRGQDEQVLEVDWGQVGRENGCTSECTQYHRTVQLKILHRVNFYCMYILIRKKLNYHFKYSNQKISKKLFEKCFAKREEQGSTLARVKSTCKPLMI